MRKFFEFLFKPIYEAGFQAGFSKGWAEGYDSISKGLEKFDATARLLERRQIVELLEPLGECEPSICRKGCRGEYRCVGWAYRHAIALIKGESVQEPTVSANRGQDTFMDKGRELMSVELPQTIDDCECECDIRERERIVRLLEEVVSNWRKADLHNQADTFDYAITLIKGEN